MAASTTPLLTALLKRAVLDDHDELLKASNAALKKSKTDVEAQCIKTIALVKLDRYDDAVKLVEESGQSLRERVALEYAYALYKVGRLEEAADVAKSAENRGGQHLEAQARYKLEDSIATAEIYEAIRRQPGSSEEFDLRVNQGAVDAQNQWLGLSDPSIVKKPGREDLENFETAYNAACGSIARGELGQAEVLLKRAKELCRHNEDLTEDQKTEELLPISVQQLYVFHARGKKLEADSVADEISVDAISDLSTRAVAQSNKLLTASSISNPFLAHKTFNFTSRLPKGDKFFSYQSIPYSSNKRTVDVQALKFGGMRKPTVPNDSSLVSPEALLSSVFSAAAHARNEVSRAAIKKLLPEVSKRPNDVGLIITLVQMYVLTGNAPAAAELVKSLFNRLEDTAAENEENLRFNSGLVSILIALYRNQGRRVQIKQELAKAALYLRSRSKAPAALLHAAGLSLLELTDAEETREAAEIFSKLREQQPKDKSAIAGYVASHAMTDTGAVSGLVEKLTSVADLTRDVDVDALENAGIPQSSNALHIAQLTRSRKRPVPDGASGKPKKVRKSRLPRDYDPEKKPDPERWLPMKDRSYYRPPKGKRKSKKGRDDRTQGGAVNEDLDIDAKPAPGAPPSSGGGGGGGKKKGKKR